MNRATPLKAAINEQNLPHLSAIKHIIADRADQILHKRNFGGGWEKWLQLEIAAELDMAFTIDVMCEEHIWPHSEEQVDLWLQNPTASYNKRQPEEIAKEQELQELRRRNGFIYKPSLNQLQRLTQVQELDQPVGIELKCRRFNQTSARFQASFLEDVRKIQNRPENIPCTLVALAVTPFKEDVERALAGGFGNVVVNWDCVPGNIPLWLLYVETHWVPLQREPMNIE
ncbi:hypothetical protein N7466_003247 [Penicillium verhagenii]|uniref:uncharacterized protein n=1 Tax=Penicillium verhagenii TaxID=1562060 RepID=UPI002544FDF0|nr:uncharacterized protein N7466_003247 [Penicillium verhagenii]KAJ5936797.1 hypothetical protein N7466_003247 [Penicillium verhagenii]